MAISVLDRLTEGVKGIPSFDWHLEKKGKPRIVWSPNRAAREVQNRLRCLIKSSLEKYDLSIGNQVYGSTEGCSYVENGISHDKNRFFYQLDLESAYPTVNPHMAAKAFCYFFNGLRDREREVSAFLSRYCFLSPEMIQACRDQGVKIDSTGLMAKEIGGLITGGPVAPLLFDLTLSVLIDMPIIRLLNNYFDGQKDAWYYTRYIDDIVLSFKSHRIANDHELRRKIRQIILNAGFGISHHKSRLLDIKKGAIPITGVNLVLGPKGVYCKLSRSYLEEIRDFFYEAAKPDSNVTLEQVAGKWGAFYACLRHRSIVTSSLEDEIIVLYHACRARLGAKDKLGGRRLQKRRRKPKASLQPEITIDP